MSTPPNTVDFLRRVPLFHGIKDKNLKQLASRCVTRKFANGEAMVTQGERGEGIFILVSGKAEAIRERADGEEVSVNTFGPTDFFGELALLNDGVRTATVYARADTQCLALARWDFLAVLREDAEMGATVSQELARRFRYTLDTIF